MSSPSPASIETVEHVVRAQLSKALGGRRGMLEAAVPTLIFTVTWLVAKEPQPALALSIGAALVALTIRLVQRSSPQFVVNALIGIGIGWFFVHLSASNGGDKNAQALAFFLPGLIYNSGYAVLLAFTCLIGWPLVGFMVGSVAGDATAWHGDRQVVRLCTLLTWVLTAPCLLRIAIQWPIWLAAKQGSFDEGKAIASLGVLKVAMGWPLQLAALAAMVWVLARDRTPVADAA